LSPLIICLLAAIAFGTPLAVAAQPDIIIADFEASDYGAWKVTGKAFGPGPAQGTLPNQMEVTGFKGNRLVNTYYKGDATIGTLTSPEFVVCRDYITFLIGGGGHADKTCMNLLYDGKVIRTATGPNTRPGGSEELELKYWDVSDLRDKKVVVQIVDDRTEGWGHINVDQIIQTDTKPEIPIFDKFSRDFTVTKRYLVIPIKNGAKKCVLTVSVDGTPVRHYDTELATDPEQVDWYAFFTMDQYQGKAANLTVDRTIEEGFALIRQADTVPGSDTWYTEPLRPQIHFSQKVGWNNDVNGMVYYDGEYHLFFQHNPVGWGWGNMTWGHAVSKDLVHWEQFPNTLFPVTMAVGACFSGGGVVDKNNTAGFKTDDEDVIVAFITDTGAGEAMAYSNDRGRTFTWYEGNPVVKHEGRDPKVIWYSYDKNDQPLNDAAKKLGGHWVMAVYNTQGGRRIAIYTSTDLKNWAAQSYLEGYHECPELFELPIDKNKKDTKWVIYAGDAKYVLGSFDGKVFTPEHEGKHQIFYGNYYAAQTFDNVPHGRRIQMAWARIDMPGMPFNQTFSFPHEMTLRTTAEGVRMFAEPVKEIEKLYVKKHTVRNLLLSGETPVSVQASGQLFDIRATFEIDSAGQVGLDIAGERVVYDVAAAKLNQAAIKPVDGKMTIRVLVDRPMMEIIGNDGRVYITQSRKPEEVSSIQAFAARGTARLIKLEVHELDSIWGK
jgi:fructan beta-fructosidase